MIHLLMKKKRIYLVSLIFIIIAIILFLPYKQALVFEYQNTGKVLVFLPLKSHDTFKMKYTHSIHLTSVVESYAITKKKEIKQYELMYENFAIGMPSDAGEGEVFEEKDGKYYIKNMNRIFPSFDLRVGKVRANHTIIYKNKEYPLSKSITPGTWIRIHVKRVNMIESLKGVNILEL
ncbi:DUF1850 domain-containing protein [Bacillus sp. CGMCC 1.16607]|uniref:DUF1850 domain-containing protein n=1 Tax=Bacillus sp. CGMCC 1.16607 TaxID=3351842 RepID=UPI003631E03C